MRFLVLMTFFLFVSSNYQINADAEKSLQVHNSARAEVGVADLIWSKELQRDAKNYAEILASKDNGLVHSKSKRNKVKTYILGTALHHYFQENHYLMPLIHGILK